FYDRRVRVVSLREPGTVVFEANTHDNPHKPHGGVWRVTGVEFLARGRYLLAEYSFDGRLTAVVLNPTDIFDTDTWQKVWHENSEQIRAVTLSNDGKKLAFIRNGVLEIGDFIPVAQKRRK
ncbi:MAG: hypothetical protein N2255_08815, partial [Kiritimatiellae bacterium]|nr:hypothetical protein [Kiritimatiellia bacterium]